MKNKQMKRKIIFCLIVLAANRPVNAIQKTTANIGTGLVAMLSAAGSYQGMIFTDGKVHPACFGVASVLLSGGTYCFLHTITPEGRLKRANKHLDELARHKLVKNSFDSDHDFF